MIPFPRDGTPPRDLTSQLLVWMSRQERVLASVPIMTDIYLHVKNTLTDTGTSGILDSTICDILTDEKNFLWIPDKKPEKPSGQKRLPLEWGSMISLDNVVLEDGLIFIPIGGPVTVLYDYYNRETIPRLFSRTNKEVERVCYPCKAIEGMFGASGLPFENGQSNRGNQKCECADSGFGRYDIFQYRAENTKQHSTTNQK